MNQERGNGGWFWPVMAVFIIVGCGSSYHGPTAPQRTEASPADTVRILVAERGHVACLNESAAWDLCRRGLESDTLSDCGSAVIVVVHEGDE